jgi:serine/threonine protein kinase
MPDRQPDGQVGRSDVVQPVTVEVAQAAIPQLRFAINPATIPSEIAEYRILSLLGEGGMGVVYAAEQRNALKRRVALKVLKLGMDSREFLARFEVERQALAMMDHPNVAQVFDAGATSDGRPFFVMEYVPGEPLTAYCDRQRLTIDQRLELFLQVCAAVQHAHQKAIIHRDLKPGNVLVSVKEAKPHAKVIDFGIAKSLSQPLTDKTLYTQHFGLLGTPAYMSPEQAEMCGVDIDTRSDIYSLGVMLYELLCGSLPFNPETLRAADVAVIRRLLRELEAPRMSSSLAGYQPASEIAARRNTSDHRLSNQLRSDLDWIPWKAMQKDRTRRYQTVAELADDVQNYLSGRPLVARPDTVWYQAKKFTRRHRAGVAAAAAILVALLAGFASTTFYYLRAESWIRTAQQMINNGDLESYSITSPAIVGVSGEAVAEEQILNLPLDVVIHDNIYSAAALPQKGNRVQLRDLIAAEKPTHSIGVSLLSPIVRGTENAYRNGGYIGVVVRFDDSALRGHLLTLRVDEGRIGEIRLLGPKSEDPAYAWILKQCPMRPGTLLHQPTLHKFLEDVKKKGLNLGYTLAYDGHGGVTLDFVEMGLPHEEIVDLLSKRKH